MEKKINLKNPVHFLAIGFGSGLLKPAPGTWGTLAGLMLSILLWNITQSNLFFIFLAVISFIFGCYLCQKTSNDLGVHDDGRIVWDEIVAIFLMFVFLPEYNLFTYILTFISFRVFDILKPYPIRYFDEKLESGLGIMVDDILAAIFALISLYIIYWII
ncbi:phosphatidylglycerophosphatase A [Haemophilus parahaemolyticus]|uniref:phosphatidylglycerophosphatase A family protein n=1 Tax=Haemophilus parahaemolyticus TaxID=735 RepID=UPI00258D76D1|nr:phosphatidylglycerophosphatase A [Haemophilus parahaemolyticus]MDQ6575639.1 phosphatidylglycerophosphatase A [Haemophilus parahaemolyticus]